MLAGLAVDVLPQITWTSTVQAAARSSNELAALVPLDEVVASAKLWQSGSQRTSFTLYSHETLRDRPSSGLPKLLTSAG